MSYRPFVSVVIPTYNRAQQVNAALNSALAQSYPNFEVIIVDDGSDDDTQEQIQRISNITSANYHKIRYFFESNQGPSAARNRGIAEARGEWIAFLDSDDVWYSDKLEWQVRALGAFKGQCNACVTDAHLINHVGTDTTSFHESKKHYTHEIGIAPNVVENLAKSFNHFWVTCLLVRADLARLIGGFDPNIKFAEDNDFTFRLSLVTAFCYVNKPLAQVDRRPGPTATRPWEKTDIRLRNSQLMLEKWLSMDAKLSSKVRKIIVQNLRQIHSSWGNWYLETGQYKEARRALSRALKVELTGPLLLKWMLAQIAPSFARKLTPKAKAYTS